MLVRKDNGSIILIINYLFTKFQQNLRTIHILHPMFKLYKIFHLDTQDKN